MTGKKYLNYEQSYNQLVIQFNELNIILIQTQHSIVTLIGKYFYFIVQ